VFGVELVIHTLTYGSPQANFIQFFIITLLVQLQGQQRMEKIRQIKKPQKEILRKEKKTSQITTYVKKDG
jgi:hypothetical protein